MPTQPPDARVDDSWESRPHYRRLLASLRDVVERATGMRALLVGAGELLHALLDAERIALWVVDEAGQTLSTLARSGGAGGTAKIPKAHTSITGHAAVEGATVVVRDAYDADELARVHPDLHHDAAQDKATGSRTRQCLAAPMVGARGVLGVIEFINSRDGQDFQRDDVLLAQEVGRMLGAAIERLRTRSTSMRPAVRRFGALVTAGVLSAEALAEAEKEVRPDRDLGAVLLDAGVPREVLGRCLSEQYGLRFFAWDERYRIPWSLKDRFQPGFLRGQVCAPIELRPDGTLLMAVEDPSNLELLDMIRQRRLATRVEFLVGLRADILAYLEAGYAPSLAPGQASLPPPVVDYSTRPEARSVAAVPGDAAILRLLQQVASLPGDTQDDEGRLLDDPGDDAPEALAARLVRQIVVDAAARGASDVHIEPNGPRDPVRVRFRIDGDCVDYAAVPPSYRNNLVQRLKVIADLDIAERRRPQDGRFRVKGPNGVIEVRIATLPTVGENEDIVMRLLSAWRPLPLDELCLSPVNLAAFQEMISNPYGIVLTVGQTGSGKTTTLHAAISHLNGADRKILTVEDPVEIVQPGLRQVQVNARIGLGFPEVLRSFLRSDPDVILVGEMRDRITAGIAIEASLTGHLVLSTLQSNTAIETVPRLLSMDVDPVTFADALRGVLAQRLVRRLCAACRESTPPTPGEWNALAEAYGDGFDRFSNTLDAPVMVYRAAGCEQCRGTGYRGRVALHEILPGTERVKRLIRERASIDALRAAASAEGMTTMLQDGVQKVLAGVTDFKQVSAACVT